MNISRVPFIATVLVFLTLFSGCSNVLDDESPQINFNPSATRTLVSTLGTDTLTVEVFTRTENEISGILVERNPFTTVTRYAAMLAADGTIRDFSADQTVPEENASQSGGLSWEVVFSDGEATITRKSGQNPGTSTFDAPRGTIPTLGRASSAGFVFEQVARQLNGSRSPGDGVMLVGPTSTSPRKNNSSVVSADSVSMDFFGAPRYGWFGEGRQLLGASGNATTMKNETRRSLPLDARALAARWAMLDAAGNGIGTPSPRAEISATLGRADIEIIYSRPAKRGRDIWGGLVSFDEVWRTGANAATQFSTSRDLLIGDTRIPAGTYTLWTTFAPHSQTLIINSQTGQWGTQYDESRDFARISMSKSPLQTTVERFTISVENTDDGGILALDWDTTRFFVHFSTR